MHYVYLLHSDKLDKFYIGETSNLRQRFYTHNNGGNKATKVGLPWKLVYYEAYPTKSDALKREQKLKRYGKGLAELKRRITIS